MTVAELKEFLSTPLALFILMLFGTALSVLKQLIDARANGSMITVSEYFLKVETFIVVGLNVLAFIGLVMTDTLNWTGAIGIGYALNSVTDLKPGGRSADIIEKIPEEK